MKDTESDCSPICVVAKQVDSKYKDSLFQTQLIPDSVCPNVRKNFEAALARPF